VGSNPTPGAFSSTQGVFVQKIEPATLSEIINFGLWMQKQGYRHSTVKYCVQALKSIARKTRFNKSPEVRYRADQQNPRSVEIREGHHGSGPSPRCKSLPKEIRIRHALVDDHISRIQA
jgi:hypothetical protein